MSRFIRHQHPSAPGLRARRQPAVVGGLDPNAGGGGPQTIALNQVTETSTAQAIARLKTKAIGQVSETSTAQALTRLKSRVLGLTTETSTAQPFGKAKVKAIGQVTETDVAQAFARVKARALGLTSETDTAQSFGKAKTKAIGLATETDTAQPITFTGSKIIALNQVAETDTAQALARAKLKAIVQAAESDAAQAIARIKAKALGQAAETDSAQAFGKAKAKAFGQALETDTAQPFTLAVPATIWDEVIDGYTARELLRGFAAVLLGKSSGHEANAPRYRDLADTLDRIAASTDANGNRSAVTLNLSGSYVTAPNVWDEIVDGGYTVREVFRGIAAVLMGKASGLESNAPKYRDLGDTTNRVDAVTDGDGNRTAVTLDL